jgi:hypothetical protein
LQKWLNLHLLIFFKKDLTMKKRYANLLIPFLISSSVSYIAGCAPSLPSGPNPTEVPSSSASPSAATSVNPSANPTAAASVNPTPAASSASSTSLDLTVGAKVENSFFAAYGPTSLHAGTKWVYTVNVDTGGFGNTSSELTIEVLAVNGDEITIQTTAGGQVTTSKSSSAVKPSVQGAQNTDFTFEGFEDVTVPAGTYNGAAKVSANATSSGVNIKMTYWYAKGVGPVKIMSEITSPVQSTSNTVLKQFVN